MTINHCNTPSGLADEIMDLIEKFAVPSTGITFDKELYTTLKSYAEEYEFNLHAKDESDREAEAEEYRKLDESAVAAVVSDVRNTVYNRFEEFFDENEELDEDMVLELINDVVPDAVDNAINANSE